MESEIRTNAAGQPIAVSGPTPRSVLNAFCEATRKPEHREPMSVVLSGDGWLGYFRQAGALHAIAIRTDARSGGWIAGNGLEPLPVTEASRVRLEPVRARVPRDGNEAPATATSR